MSKGACAGCAQQAFDRTDLNCLDYPEHAVRDQSCLEVHSSQQPPKLHAAHHMPHWLWREQRSPGGFH